MEIFYTALDYFKGHDGSNELYYNVTDCDEIREILISGKIMAGGERLFDPFTEKKQHFVQFGRYDKFGLKIILDLKKLSERYKITPYNSRLEALRKNGLDVHRIVAYCNDTYEADRMNISRDIYNVIREAFLSVNDEEKRTKNIIVSNKGKSPKKGTELAEYISCNKRNCTVHVPADSFTSSQLHALSICEESKPVIWLDDVENFIDVSDCVTGIFSLTRMYGPTDEEEMEMIDVLRPLCEKSGKALVHECVTYYPEIHDYYVLCDDLQKYRRVKRL